MSTRTLAKIAAPGAPHFVGDGFRVHNFIPGAYTMQQLDPFIMLDYNSAHYFEPSEIPRGVGVHPHKGFETVTIAYQGKVEHGDSTGSGGVIHEGDVQWMTAGNGILHKEHHEKEWSKQGGVFQMVQLWVNLPAKDKGTEPGYQNLRNADMAKVELEDQQGVIEVIAGEYQGHKGSASTFSPVHLYNAKLKKGAKIKVDFPADFTTAALAIQGTVTLNGSETLAQDHFALFNKDGEEIEVEAQEDAVVLILSGQPLNEPIVAQGPFVMNTREEIRQAIDDYSKGRFGTLV